jgi:hypothetical protein
MTETLRTNHYAIRDTMTNNEITAIWESMPGKFMVDWGYQQFAHKLLEAVERPVPDLQPLKAELRFCVENGTYGPRTGATLRWAMETLEEIMEEEVKG